VLHDSRHVAVLCARVRRHRRKTGATVPCDVPTAGMLPKGTVNLDVDFYQEGGVLLGVSFGIFNRLSLGLSYGGSNLIGGDKPVMNEVPECT